MSRKLRTVLYWLSIVRPIADILLGAWKGVVMTIQNDREYERRMREIALLEEQLKVPSLKDYQGDNEDERIEN